MKTFAFIIAMLALSCLNEAIGQWTTTGSNIYNTNAGNVGIGNSTPTTLLHVAKSMTEPTITVQNLGGSGGATYTMIDGVSGANWKFKATNTGGFKIRDHANLLDVFVIEPNSAANALYINGDGYLGLGTATPGAKLHVAGHIWQTSTGESVFIGVGAGANDDLDYNYNVFVGYQAGYLNNSGICNTANGHSALRLNTSGSHNTAFGYWALYNNSEGALNTANGAFALNSNANGTGNTANGYGSLYSNISGGGNTANGAQALNQNIDGNYNSAIGWNALFYNTSGCYNTAIGMEALNTNTTGHNNIALGYDADVATGDLNNATAIGANAYAGASNSIVLGSIAGVNGAAESVSVGIGTTTPAPTAALDISSTTKGFLPPRMTQAQIEVIESPANGLIVFCTTDNKFYGYLSGISAWKEIMFGTGTIYTMLP
jgi:hypothetical protein